MCAKALLSLLIAATPLASLCEEREPTEGVGQTAAPAKEILERVSINAKGVRDPNWISYRDTFTAMNMYRGAVVDSDPLEPRFRLKPLMPSPPRSEDLRMRLVGPNTNEFIPMSGLWGEVPLREAAVKDGADFTLNAEPGTFQFVRIIAVRRLESGQYTPSYLRAACTKSLEVLRGMNLAYKIVMAFKSCKGVRFYLQRMDGSNLVEAKDNGLKTLVSDAPEDYSVLEYRFDQSASLEMIKFDEPVIAIVPIYER